jgi:mannose-6-phosphate isomerase-like protein (cupin superfamily)
VRKVRLAEALATFNEHWSPRIVGHLNGQHVKLAKFQGPFVWHHHADADEMFLVLSGSFRMDYRDASGTELSMEIGPGEFVIVPRGMEHRPHADSECSVLLFEPAGTLNTGNVLGEFTVDSPVDLLDDQ